MLKDINWVREYPKYQELAAEIVWNKVKHKPEVKKFFPDYPESRLPAKEFLMNVLNTIKPESIIDAIKHIKEGKDQQRMDEGNIVLLTDEY